MKFPKLSFQTRQLSSQRYYCVDWAPSWDGALPCAVLVPAALCIWFWCWLLPKGFVRCRKALQAVLLYRGGAAWEQAEAAGVEQLLIAEFLRRPSTAQPSANQAASANLGLPQHGSQPQSLSRSSSRRSSSGRCHSPAI